jgi:superfamily I DNA/RNA helicase
MLTRAEGCHHLPVKYAIIDEAQDLSAAQWRVCHYLLRGCETVWIAGDDDQAIYRFSGADAGTFVEMDSLDTSEVLHQSYRLPQEVFEYSQKLVKRIGTRVDKKFTTEKPGGKVSRSWLSDLSMDEGEWMLLVRNRTHMKIYEERLRASGHAYRMDGRSSIPASDLQGIQAWEKVRKQGGMIARNDVAAIFSRLSGGKGGVKHGMKTKLSENLPMEQKEFGWDDIVAAGVLMNREVVWYDALQAMKPSQRLYLRAVAKRGELFEDPRITVNTIHGVKGGEADNVVILPAMGRLTWEQFQNNPDDEHRCAYVAATRAKQNLHILMDGDRSRQYPY